MTCSEEPETSQDLEKHQHRRDRQKVKPEKPPRNATRKRGVGASAGRTEVLRKRKQLISAHARDKHHNKGSKNAQQVSPLGSLVTSFTL